MEPSNSNESPNPKPTQQGWKIPTWVIGVIAILAAAGSFFGYKYYTCNQSIVGPGLCPCNTQSTVHVADSTLLILSIPNWVSGEKLRRTSSMLSDTTKALKINLSTLWRYDSALYEALLANDSIGRFIYTRKYNPCCPCTESGKSCCSCPRYLTLAAPKSMQTTATNQSGTALASSTVDGVVLYYSTESDTTVTITGNGIQGSATMTKN